MAATCGRTGSPSATAVASSCDGESEGDDGAVRVGRPQGAQGPYGGIDVGDDDGSEGFPEGGLDRRLPAGFDAHEVEQRPEHAVASGEMLGAGPGMRRVEGELQRLHPGVEVRQRLGHVAAVLGRLGQCRLRLGDATVGGGDLVDQRCFEQLDGHAVVAMALGLAVELGESGGERVATGSAAQQFGLAVLAGGDPGAQLAAHLGQGAGSRRPGRCVERPEQFGALGDERRLLGNQLVEVRAGSIDRRVHGVELGAILRGVGLEGGDDRLVEQLSAVAFEATSTLGDDRREAPGAFAQLIGASQAFADVVGAAGRQLGFEGHDVGIEPDELGLQPGLVVGRRGSGCPPGLSASCAGRRSPDRRRTRADRRARR